MEYSALFEMWLASAPFSIFIYLFFFQKAKTFIMISVMLGRKL